MALMKVLTSVFRLHFSDCTSRFFYVNKIDISSRKKGFCTCLIAEPSRQSTITINFPPHSQHKACKPVLLPPNSNDIIAFILTTKYSSSKSCNCSGTRSEGIV